VAKEPCQPIPEATLAHVDRLIGARLGEYQVLEKAGEGRFGTLYRGSQPATGQQVTIQVLRAELRGNDEEAKAAKAIGCAGIASVLGFGTVPDGRRYRVFERLDGVSLAELVERRGRLGPEEVSVLVARVAGVLEAAHAWGIAHGCLDLSNVFVVGSAVKVIDFGLAKQPATAEGDLKALGALGFALLTGEELVDRAPPPLDGSIPELLDRLLRELLEKRLSNATEARKEFEALQGLLDAPAGRESAGPLTQQTAVDARPMGEAARGRAATAAPKATARRRTMAAIVAGVVLVVGGGLGAWSWLGSSSGDEAAENDDEYDFEAAAAEEAEQAAGGEQSSAGPRLPEQRGPPEASPDSPRPHSKRAKSVRSVPSVKALSDEIGRLEARLRKEARPGEDLSQALFMLNKQRLRLTGSPTVADRQDVARQLAGWRRSYLHH
jgi:serine/threonine-protein kinase